MTRIGRENSRSMAADQRLVEIVRKRRGPGAERGEDHALVRGDAQLGEAMVLGIEVRRIAAHARHAAAVGDAHQVAARIVGPLVIDAAVLAGVAAGLALHGRAAMGATIDEGMQAAVLGAADDDRRVADERRLEVVRVRDLRFQRDVVPDRAAKDGLPFAIEHVASGEHVERHAAAVPSGPGDWRSFARHGLPPLSQGSRSMARGPPPRRHLLARLSSTFRAERMR
jgi:hypothetical protein